MSDLIKYLLPIVQMEDSVQAVMGRDLHKFLQIGARYNDWFPRMVAYGFEEGTDYLLKNEYPTPPAGNANTSSTQPRCESGYGKGNCYDSALRTGSASTPILHRS